MMNKSDLLAAADLFRQREKLAETRAGLVQMAESAPGMELRDIIDEIDDGIAALDEQIKSQRAAVESIISQVKTFPARTVLRLRLPHGLTWKEAGACVGVGLSEKAAGLVAYKALNSPFPDKRGEK